MNNFTNRFESFYLSNDLPLDKKTKISSLTNLDEELPLFHRYLGLIFFVSDIKKFYTFKTDINNAELLFADNIITNTFGIYVDLYQNILTELNNYISLGKIIYVFPLNVAFYYDGTTWKYYSGIYNLRTNIDLNNLPNTLKSAGQKVTKDGLVYLWNTDNNLIPFLTSTNTQENLNIFNNTQTLNDRFYKHREQIFKVFNNKIYKNFTKQIQQDNFTISIGETKLTEFLLTDIGDINLPPYINAKLWITNNININTNTPVLIPYQLDIFYLKTTGKWEVYCSSDINLTGTLELEY